MSSMNSNKKTDTCLSAHKLVLLLSVVFAVMAAAPASAQIIATSDDFSGPSLDTGLWTFIDPVGDSSVTQANGTVTLSVPAGTAHDLWISGNNSARIVQPVTNSDLGLEVKFESLPVTPYQIQGLLLEESPGNYIRLDFFHDGTDLNLFGASFIANSPSVEGGITLPSGSPLWLRVVRATDTFTVTWSDDGVTFNPGFSFTHTLALSSVGVYVGNNELSAGSGIPAYDAVVDFFFDTADPIAPEDGGLIDIWPPVVTNIVVTPDSQTDTALVTCTTSETATTLLSFGLTTSYGTDIAGTTGDGLTHQFTLSTLLPDSLYHFSILATDTLTNSAATVDQQFLNADVRPIVTVWGGLNQRVGHLGSAQADFNLMGTIELWDTLATLTYSLNGGPDLPLNWGLGIDDFGDHRRLAHNGDFNVDIPLGQLLAGPNTISVHAVANDGKEDTALTNVNLETGSSPLPMNIDWATVTDPQDVGQYVDGSWTNDASGLRTATTGYDRLFLFGEDTWQDYEIVCPITINEVKTPTGPLSGNPGLGFLMRFDGHVVGGHRNWPAAQPKWGYQPFGGLGWLRWLAGPTNDPTVQFYHGDYDVTESYSATQSNERSFEPAVSPALIPFGDAAMVTEFGTSNVGKVGETFLLKMRSETLPDAVNGDGVTLYSFKTWLDTEPEPAAWTYQFEQQSEFALREGAVALLAHHVDVTFGDVSIIDLSTSTPPVSQDDALTVTVGTSGVVDVLANDSDVDGVLVPNTVTVISAPLNGSISNIDPVTGAITYLHDGGVALADSFTYTVDDDDALTSNTSTVRVTIVPVTPPVAGDDNVIAVIGGSADIDILANDTAVGGAIDPATVAIVSGPANGVLGTPDPLTGIVNYTHDGGGSVSDTFTYTVDDDLGTVSNLATVTISIEAPVAPTAVDDAAFASVGSAADLNVLANDTVGNGAIDPATVTIVTPPSSGTITGINLSTGVVTYTHDGGITIADSFTYEVDDVNGATSNVATVNMTVGQVPAGQFVSDDFNNCNLNPIWTFVDPQGDSTAPTIQGAFTTGDAQVAILVPGGASHELFNGTIGAPYIIQDTADTDFTLEVKFGSSLPAVDFAEQGIIVRQDDANWLRLEFYTRATDQIYVLAGLPNNLGFPTNELIPGLVAGTTPIYMRVERVGDTWTQSYSTDGTNWTALAAFIHPITVSGVGVYGGNADTNPAHTVLVDYFSNTLAPIIEPDDTGLNTLTTMIVGNGSIGRDFAGPNYSCGDLVQLTATPDPGYAFDSWSGDLTGSVNPETVTMDGPLNITASFIATGPPEAPVANDDAIAVLVGNSGNVDVLANDTDLNANIDPSTVAIVSAPLNGTITNIDLVTGVVTYLHDGGVSVSDSLTYTVEDDGGLLSNQATVTITVDPLVAPTAVDDALVVLVGAAGDVDVLSNDTVGNGAIDPGTVTILSAPLHGLISAINAITGVVTYTHDGGLDVTDSFTYTVDDVNGATSNFATVNVSIGAVPPGEFVSDDFNSCDLNPIWTFVDPMGDSTQPTILGAYSGDSQVGISVPGGSAHEMIGGAINVPYIIQSTNDNDFTVEVKFDSVLPTANYAEQGIIVRQDDANWLRLEFFSQANGELYMLAGLPNDTYPNSPLVAGATAGTSPLYMRVQRVGNDWTQSYSLDGANWTAQAAFTYAMNVTGVGVYGGNADSNPAHTVLVDYFSNALAPIVEPDDNGQNTLTTAVVGSGTIDRDLPGPNYACGDMVLLTANAGAGYAFDSWSGDLTGSVNPATVTMDGPLNVTANFIVSGPPVAPVANDDAMAVVIADTVEVDVLANDTDLNGDIDPITVVIVNDPLNGSIISIDAVTGAISYLHNGGVALADSFTYTVEDAGSLLSNEATVRITIDPPVAPVAQDDVLVLLTGTSGDVDVLDNDSDSDGVLVPSTVVVVSPPSNGTITNIDAGTGVVTYLHDGGPSVSDSFTYTVEDDHGAASNVATVNITINPLVAPTAVNDALMVLVGAAGDVDVLSNDTDGNSTIDPGTVTIVSSPLHGLISNINVTTGVVTYTHDGGFDVTDSFTYTVDDINGATSNVATVSVDIGAIPPGEFVSDDFNSCDLKPIWTFVNPMGDSSQPLIVGAFSGDAKVAIGVPGGSPHELYNGVINAPYIIQSTTDNDFTLEVKFDSALPVADYAEQGIIVREDDSSWLRMEFFSQANGELYILAGLPDNSNPHVTLIAGAPAGTSPLYMRVQRVGNDWTQSYSLDGTNWTASLAFSYAMNVTGVGVYGGNANSNPAHAVLVDYFSNTLAPIVEPDDVVTNSIATTIIGSGTIDRDLPGPNYACGDMVELTANPMVGFAFGSWSGDVTGNANPITVTMDGPLNVTATFVGTTFSTIAANTSGVLGLSTANTCESGVPIEITRDNATNMRAFSATLNLNNLELCNGVASIQEGTYLSSIGATTFQVVDNLDGTFDINGSIIGSPCGAIAPSGELFTIDVANTIADGTGTITITNVDISDCDGFALAVQPGSIANIVIDSTGPINVTSLGATQVLLGNPAGNVTGIDLAWNVSSDPTSVQTVLYRKGFGFYPEYDDAGGAAPAVPTDPIAEGWVEAATLTPVDAAFTDLTGTRDYWYFCAVSVDLYGNQSTSLITPGVLNYLLGDVSDGGGPMADGDNVVSSPDVSLMGASYGTDELDGLYLNTLDVGPTDDFSVAGRPTTDNVIEFEDLIVFSINYNRDVTALSVAFAANLGPSMVPDPADRNELTLGVPVLPNVGETFVVDLEMMGDGQIQGLRIPMEWDNAVIEYVGYQAGPLLAEQGGQSLALSIDDGVLDIALIGVRALGISGIGTIASATFRVLNVDVTGLGLGTIDARDKNNNHVDVNAEIVSGVGDTPLPQISALNANYPNPFNPMTTLSFDLAKAGQVRVRIYSVDGRLVRTLVNENLAAGRHEKVWQGRDDNGRAVASGTYLYRMDGPGFKATRRMLLVK